MATLNAPKVAVLAACFVLLPNAGAFGQDSGGFDIADTPAAPPAPVPQNLSNALAEITIGVGGVTDGSAVFGRYNGMPKSGAGVFASWNIRDRDPWDSGGTRYYSFTGDNFNVGFGEIAPEASASVKIGHQGEWSITVSYDAMTYTADDRFQSILNKKGNLAPAYLTSLMANGLYFTNSTLAPPASAKFGSFNASTHLATSNPVAIYGPGNQITSNVGTRRDKGSIEGSYEIGSWIFNAAVSLEHKEGSLEQSMTTGGNNAGMVTFPMPISYDTDTYVLSAAYASPDLQAKFTYEMSNFSNDNAAGYSFQGWNFAAFKNTAATPNTYTSYARSGIYSLPPSNQAHTISAELGYNIDSTTRAYATAIYGVQLQNDPFVAATSLGYIPTNASLAASLASNPRSLSGVVETFYGNITVTSRPAPKLDLTASYTIDVRSPQTKPMWIYGDPTDNTSLKYREAVPESWTKQKASITAGYHIAAGTRVSVGYTFRDDQRGNAITHHAQDNEFWAKVNTNVAGWTGSLGYNHANRSASAPDWSLWLVQISSDCGSALALLGCQQVPFYEAARTEDAVTAMLSGVLNEKTSLSLLAKYNNDNYHLPQAAYNGVVNPGVGINHAYSIQAGPDLTYQISKNTEVHGYYTFLRTYRAMLALNNQANPTTSGLFYYGEASTYDIHTAGFGGTWQVDEKLKLGLDYTFSYGTQGFAQHGSWDSNEAGQVFGGDPSLSTISADHRVKLYASYEYSKVTALYISYQFASLDTTDWALVGAAPGQVLSGNVPPKYDVSTIMAAVTLRL